MNEKNVTKFEWGATESAPKHYPMEIIRGSFIYRNESERGLYIPSGGTLSSGWGEPISNHATGEQYKPLPDRLSITFFSYAENQFYKGEFDLPYETILSLFQQGVIENPDYPTFISIMAGIAPGGTVAVWVVGESSYKEVFFGQAEKVNLSPSHAFALPFKDKAQADAYIAKQLVNSLSPEERESLKQNGIPFDLWSRYRIRYSWVASIKNNYVLEGVDAIYFNGEYERNIEEIDTKTEKRPVPDTISFFTYLNNEQILYRIFFDESEIMDVFQKLGASGQKISIEFTPAWPRTNTTVRVYNDDESIQLKKFISDDW